MGTPSLKDQHSNQEKTFAERLHENRLIYLFFGLFDGLTNASNIPNQIFQYIYSKDQSSDRMHFWLMTPLGMALTIIEATFFTLLAMVGSYFKDQKDGSFKSKLARTWPYVRDSVKGVKGAYKAVRSVLFFAVLFGIAAASVTTMLLPIGLVVGALSLLNRVWNRRMVYERKSMEKANKELAKWNHKKNTGESLTTDEKIKLLQGNVLLVTILAKKIHLNCNVYKKESLMAIIAAHEFTDADLYACVQERSRVLERVKRYVSAGFLGLMNGLYLYAGLYLLSTLTPPVALVVSIVSLLYAVLNVVREVYEEHSYQLKQEQSAVDAKLAHRSCLSPDEVHALKARKQVLNTVTYASSLGEGVRDGISAYGAMTGVLFAIAFFTPIPVTVILCILAFGVIAIVGFTCYECYLTSLCNIKTSNPWPDANECLRSLASGVRQAPKVFLTLILDSIRESKVAFIITVIFSGIQGVIFALKAWAKGFGDPEKKHQNPALPLNDSDPELRVLARVLSADVLSQNSPLSKQRLSDPPPEPPRRTSSLFSSADDHTTPDSNTDHCTFSTVCIGGRSV